MILRSTSLTVAQGLGSAVVVLLFLSALTLIAALLHVIGDGALRSRWARDAVLPPSVRVLGLRAPAARRAVRGVGRVWRSLLEPGGYHDVRQLSRAGINVQTRSVSEAFAAWQRPPTRRRHRGGEPAAGARGGLGRGTAVGLLDGARARLRARARRRPERPASRAATKADADKVAQRRARLFAMSGVGGGGLGLVTYDTHVRRRRRRRPDGWFDQRLRRRLPQPDGGVGAVPRHARHAAAARGWPRPSRRPGAGLGAPVAPGRRRPGRALPHRPVRLEGPLIFLNGYSAQDGCRLSTSVVLHRGRAPGRPVRRARPSVHGERRHAPERHVRPRRLPVPWRGRRRSPLHGRAARRPVPDRSPGGPPRGLRARPGRRAPQLHRRRRAP